MDRSTSTVTTLPLLSIADQVPRRKIMQFAACFVAGAISLACTTTTATATTPDGKSSGDALVLKFPADRSLGGICVFLHDRPEWDEKVQKDGAACGIRTFPAGSKLRLSMNYECAEKPDHLLGLDRSIISIDARSLDNFSDKTLSYVGKMPQLTEVKIDETDVSDAGLKYLLPLKNLIMLTASHTLITGAGLSEIGKLTGLERLELGGTQLNDDSLGSLESLKKVRLLFLSKTGIGDRGLAHLQALPNLERVFLANNQRITDKGIANLVRLPNLRLLDLSDTGITSGSIRYLVQCKRLLYLEVDLKKFSPEDMKKLRAALPHCVIHGPTHKQPPELFAPLH